MIINLIIFLLIMALIETFFITNKKFLLVVASAVDDKIDNYKVIWPIFNPSIENYISDYPESEDIGLKNKIRLDLDYSNKFGDENDWSKFNLKNTESIVKLKDSDLNVYKVKFNFEYEKQDGRGFRKSSFLNNNVNFFLINLGDSCLLGEGVEQDYTLPSFLNKKMKDYNSYNFGIPGAGPNDHLKLLQDGADKRYLGVKEKSGIIIYHHLSFHLHRAICTMRCYRPEFEYRRHKPQYKFADGKLTLVSNEYLDGQSTSLLYSSLAKFETLNFYNMDFPSEYLKKDYLLYINIIKAVMEEYEKYLDVSEKIIILNPDTPTVDAENITKLATFFNIKVLNFSGYSLNKEFIKTPVAIPIDGHPTPEFNNFMSELIVRNLYKKSP